MKIKLPISIRRYSGNYSDFNIERFFLTKNIEKAVDSIS